MKPTIKKLIFNSFNSTSGNHAAWICCLDEFNSNYCIYIDSKKGKTIVSDPKYKKSVHNSIKEAMEWCQNDFERRVNNLFEDSRYGAWKEANNLHGKYSEDTAFEVWNALDENDK